MNIYRILILSCGMSREVIMSAHDMADAILQSGAMANEVIKAELIGSQNAGLPVDTIKVSRG